ncbi:MAG TPA: YidB family protein [Xanthobacteraceae bacterium]|nr:YidB family protein [Xanthobacteraceae bacterium]
MGLMDVLNGMQHGPRGPSGPSTGSSGGMSPMTMAILGLLAYKAVKSFTSQPGAAPAKPATPAAPGSSQSAGSGGGLGDVLKNGLGGLLAGGAAGSVLTGGLNDLLKQFQQSGQGDVAKTWVGTGPNKAISSDDLAKALGGDQISTLMAHTGLSRQDLLAGLSQQLPEAVNRLTPDGRLPTEQELSRSL